MRLDPLFWSDVALHGTFDLDLDAVPGNGRAVQS